MRDIAEQLHPHIGSPDSADDGFTLIELMVVLLIMAILLAIAIPTFLGVKTGAQNRAVQSDLSNALTSGKSVYTTAGFYGGTSTSAANTAAVLDPLGSTEPELHFSNSFSTTVTYNGNDHDISVLVSSNGQAILYAAQAANGTCWYAEDNNDPNPGIPLGFEVNDSPSQGVSYGSSAGATSAGCSSVDTVPTNWSQEYPSS